jgi:hypothetical protein
MRQSVALHHSSVSVSALKLVLRRFLYLAVIAIATSSSACTGQPIRELQRVRSPDGKVDAVLVLRPTGTVAPDVYQIYIVAHDSPVTWTYMVLSGDKMVNPHLVWKTARLLEFFYSQAHIVTFKNAWECPILETHPVEIRLMPPVDKLAIPDTW